MISRLRQKKLLPKLVFAVFAAAVFIASYYLGNQYARPLLQDVEATVLPRPEKLAEFRLLDKHGEVFTRESFRNFWNFVIVGNLEDSSCDNLLRLYVLAWNHLAGNPRLQKKTRVVFVHTGKQAANIKQAIEFYNPAFTAVSGDREEIQKLGKQIGLFPQDGNCHPQSSVVALVNPEGYLLALFTGAADPARIARDLQYFN